MGGAAESRSSGFFSAMKVVARSAAASSTSRSPAGRVSGISFAYDGVAAKAPTSAVAAVLASVAAESMQPAAVTSRASAASNGVSASLPAGLRPCRSLHL